MKKTVLETQRLFLKTLSMSYADKTLQFYIENKEHLYPYEATHPNYFYTKRHQRQLLKWDQQGLSESSMIRLWIFLKTSPEEPIGCISLSNICRGIFQSCSVGYKISHHFSRQGYMYEALIKVIDYAFSDLELHRIEANIMPKNEASLSLAKKCGFEIEGLTKDYLKLHGIWEDHLRLSLINRTL